MAQLFISYSHRDEKALDRLHKHLAMLKRESLIDTWHDRRILAGSDIDRDIELRLAESEIFVPLISPDFIASEYCYDKEMTEALRRHEEGSLRVIPVILEPCDWQSTPLGKLKALPKDGVPISVWSNENVAYLDVITELRRVLASNAGGNTTSQSADSQSADSQSNRTTTVPQPRRYRIKREFDAIDIAEFSDNAFDVVRDYFRISIDELRQIGDPIRARFENMGERSFSCTVLNKAIRNQEAHITVHSRGAADWGNISYSFRPRAEPNTANGFLQVAATEYELFLKLNFFGSSRDEISASPKEAAERLWQEFVAQAGLEG
ncbi:MAG: toll/interleukin-1 receptor domain-containing protein [Bradyrhizobiaceae bacterium]|nr:MAG: toll/interleukin-1 receptor domain-containing protein [Bradyrhizobiaceae bacterium]